MGSRPDCNDCNTPVVMGTCKCGNNNFGDKTKAPNIKEALRQVLKLAKEGVVQRKYEVHPSGQKDDDISALAKVTALERLM